MQCKVLDEISGCVYEGPGYPAAYGNAEMLYGGNVYPDPYAGMHQVCVRPCLLDALVLCLLLLRRLKPLKRCARICLCLEKLWCRYK